MHKNNFKVSYINDVHMYVCMYMYICKCMQAIVNVLMDISEDKGKMLKYLYKSVPTIYMYICLPASLNTSEFGVRCQPQHKLSI